MLRKPLCLLLLAMLFQGCSSLEQAGQIVAGSKPTGQVKGVSLTGLDVNGVDLAFDVEVENPNPVKIALDHLDYDLKLLDRSFLQGEQPMGLSLAANGRSQVKLPVRLTYERLLGSYRQLSKRDEVPYRLELGLGFDVPLLGRVRLPMHYQGRLPIPKMPDIRISALDVQRLTLQQADLLLELEVENPNGFALMLDKLDYQLKLNGIDVGGGLLKQSMEIGQGGRGVISLPLSLDLVRTGRGLYGALLGGSGLNYEFRGAMEAAGDMPVLGGVRIPLEKRGRVDFK